MSSIESDFLETADLSKYQGKWIAILGKKVIAKGDTISDAYDNAMKTKPAKTPLYHRIPARGEPEHFIPLVYEQNN